MTEHRDIYQEVSDLIDAQLAKGVVPWKEPFSTWAGAHRNLNSGRPYRGINVLLLAMTEYEQPLWMTFKGMRALGGTLKYDKGDPRNKGTMVTLWKRIPKKDKGKVVIDERTGKPQTMMFLRHYTVFNIEQTEGLEDRMIDLGAASVPWSEGPGDECERLVGEYPPPPPTMEKHHGEAWYSPGRDVVGMPPMSAFDSGDDYYSTLFHELVHSTGHKDRLDREGITKGAAVFGSVDYSKEELVAEFGAAMLCAEAGIFGTKRVEQTAAYIDHWRRKISEDKKLLVQAGAQAQRAVDWMIGRTFDSGESASVETTDEPESTEAVAA